MKDIRNIKTMSLSSLEKDGEVIAEYLDPSELGKLYTELANIDYLTDRLIMERNSVLNRLKALEKYKCSNFDELKIKMDEDFLEEELPN